MVYPAAIFEQKNKPIYGRFILSKYVHANVLLSVLPLKFTN